MKAELYSRRSEDFTNVNSEMQAEAVAKGLAEAVAEGLVEAVAEGLAQAEPLAEPYYLEDVLQAIDN